MLPKLSLFRPVIAISSYIQLFRFTGVWESPREFISARTQFPPAKCVSDLQYIRIFYYLCNISITENSCVVQYKITLVGDVDAGKTAFWQKAIVRLFCVEGTGLAMEIGMKETGIRIWIDK